MPYEKQIFVDGEDLLASQLDHIEDGISAVTNMVEGGGGGGSVDIDEIVQAVLDALPVYNGEVEDV